MRLVHAYAASGIRVVAATPHVSPDHPTTPDDMNRALLIVQQAVARAGIALEVVAGGEIALDRLPDLDADDLAAFSLGGGGRYVLLEFPYDGWPGALAEAVATLQDRGIDPILAHPERNAVVQSGPQRLAGLVASGALVQVTASSLAGTLGSSSAAAARTLVASGLAHVVAGDLHQPGSRSTIDVVSRLLPERIATLLTTTTPQAILAGERPPMSSASPRRRFGARWR